jgi:hypothetical protein
MDQNLRLRQLRALVEVARASRITKAAAALNISQPAISRLIRCLEAGLGVALFERTQQRLVPTPFGLVLNLSHPRTPAASVERLGSGIDMHVQEILPARLDDRRGTQQRGGERVAIGYRALGGEALGACQTGEIGGGLTEILAD